MLSLVLTACGAESDAGEKGVLKIVTDPGDARIYINGKRKGNSPAEKGQTFAIQLAEGEYKVEAIKSSGGPEELYGVKNDVFVAEDTMVQTITLKLEKRPSQAFRIQLKAQYGDGVPEPEMLSIPGGRFRMGDIQGGGDSDEKPVHRVSVQPFLLAKTEVTFAQYDVCVAFGGCTHLPEDRGWGRGERPVINVSWDDAQQYIQWLNQRTGKNYRLPSEAEWEYAARAGSETKYSWGNEIGRNKANCGSGCGDSYEKIAPVSSFPANAFGLQDMHGNVWEWTQDCWNDKYNGAPTDGTAWEQGDCSRRVFRGGSWFYGAGTLRSAFRGGNLGGYRSFNLGFRLARDAR